MLDALRRLAVWAAPVRNLALIAGALSLVTVASIAVTSSGDRLLIPGLVGLLWSLSTYAFVTTFRFVPAPTAPGEGRIARLKRRLKRGWYGLLALVCVGSTVAAVWVSFRLASIWWREF